MHAGRARVLAEHLSAMVEPGATLLDVGCGDGLVARLLGERRPDLTVAGVDVARRTAARIPVTVFDGRRLPFGDRSWETVLLCDVLHHAEEPVALLAEAARVARSRVLVKDHVVAGWLARPTLRFMDFVGNAPQGIARPGNYFTPRQWQQAFAECALRSVETRRRLGLYPRWSDPLFGRGLHFLAALAVAR